MTRKTDLSRLAATTDDEARFHEIEDDYPDLTDEQISKLLALLPQNRRGRIISSIAANPERRGWDRECVKCRFKWLEVDWGVECPACEGEGVE